MGLDVRFMILDDVMSVQSDTTYQRASKVVHELHRQMKSQIEICDVLYGEDDIILRDIAVEMKRDIH